MKFTGLLSEMKQNSQNIMLESLTSRSDSTMHQPDTIFLWWTKLQCNTRNNWEIWTNIKDFLQLMIINKKYCSIVYISEILLFFQTSLFLFRKFTKRLYSTSPTEKYVDSWNKQVK